MFSNNKIKILSNLIAGCSGQVIEYKLFIIFNNLEAFYNKTGKIALVYNLLF